MIKVEVALYASLRQYHPKSGAGSPMSVEVEEGTTARELLEGRLGIPPEVVKLVFVNAVVVGSEHVLADGDRLGAFPPIAGG